MDGDRIREGFLRFFEERGHRRVPSSSLIPPPESGLLLTNAGMNQFIPYFLGHASAPFARAVTVQKCFRTVDIENVGRIIDSIPTSEERDAQPARTRRTAKTAERR